MSTTYEAQGIVRVIDQTKEVGAKGFKVREFVLELPDDKYPQEVQFQLTGDRCAKLDGIGIGSVVDVSFNLRGRSWTSPKTGEVSYFNKLEVWKLDVVKAAQAPEPATDGVEYDIPF